MSIKHISQDDIDLLIKLCIPREQWNDCFIINNKVYIPEYDETGKIIRDGKTIYNDWNQYKENNKTQKPLEQKLKEVYQEFTLTKIDNENNKLLISQLLLESAKKDIELSEQKKLSAQLVLMIAELQLKNQEVI